MSKKVPYILGISFKISCDNVPLQSNKPEVNVENETSKQPSVSTSPRKADKSTHTKYDKHALSLCKN